MFKKVGYLFLALSYSAALSAMAADSEFSATPDYSYDSYRSQDSPSASRRSGYTPSNRDNNASSRTFSSNVMINKSRSQSGYSPQAVGSNTNYSPQNGSNSAYYKTNPYRY
jgi:hypothetical protein